MADTRSAAEIEREIEAERTALTRTLDEIQDRLSFEHITNDLMGTVREHSGDIGRSLSRQVRDNPIPLALTAIGLAWLAIGSGRRSSARYDYDDRYASGSSRDYARERSEMIERDRAERSRYATTPRPVYDASGRPVAATSYVADDDDDDDGESRWDRAKGSAAHARDAVAGKLQQGRDSASAGAHSASASAQSGMARTRAGMGRMSEGARVRAQGAYASAAELRGRITHGTRNMSEAARARVLAARTRAYEAQLRAEHYATRGRDRAMDLYEEQPLIGGVVAMALGAAIGAALPRTQREDEAFGAYRDDLFEEAERIYREERDKLGEVARATADEARKTAREVAADASERAKEGAGHVAETARSEAEKKNLGQQG